MKHQIVIFIVGFSSHRHIHSLTGCILTGSQKWSMLLLVEKEQSETPGVRCLRTEYS